MERKGAMRGGYIDKRRSKLQAWRRFNAVVEELKKAQKAAKEVEQKLRIAEEEMASAANKYSKSKVRLAIDLVMATRKAF